MQRVLGPFRNGGIGTAYTKLGQVLNEAGHDVTFLYSNGQYTETEPVEHWVEVYRESGIEFVPLPDCPVQLSSLSHRTATSYRVYLWFRQHSEFDVVHFPECGGTGFHTLVAKHQGLLLRRSITVVGLHSSSRWIRTASHQLASTEGDLEDDYIERRSAELADIVWSPGQYMLDWARQQGWNLPRTLECNPSWCPTSRAYLQHTTSPAG